MKVYAIFTVFGEGDSYSIFTLEKICNDKKTAWEKAKDVFNNLKSTKKISNILACEDVKKDASEMCDFSHFGGIIIEEMDLEG